ncbi:hypothetical protein BURPS406E_H0172 [Burkholderia pseudomallei 406e]|uniref:Uncharacterized protein n=1 Tax=Burkholderia pseudomallei 1710a TaxID=320371 RepID=A0A0E1W1Q7_BURPE|nr:hypothetical protein BURPS406E_H0172 [Burkholderia pseudomallei 406e]EDS85392.1 hypothetical protein BURPSS13_V0085 [Burkholderia pseudomallei S13]EDU11824.1 hypothetical protein BURPS1655_H0081 [Burkholderia pseudomallei 1655]EET06241.1 hypothetical protein BURPS1710A_3291 [Burkholderia pseudomallei 1710a]
MTRIVASEKKPLKWRWRAMLHCNIAPMPPRAARTALF